MARKPSPFITIPIFLNLILLAGIPYFGGMTEVVGLIPVLVLALATPWLLYFIIGRILESVAREARKRDNGDGDTDFI